MARCAAAKLVPRTEERRSGGPPITAASQRQLSAFRSAPRSSGKASAPLAAAAAPRAIPPLRRLPTRSSPAWRISRRRSQRRGRSPPGCRARLRWCVSLDAGQDLCVLTRARGHTCSAVFSRIQPFPSRDARKHGARTHTPPLRVLVTQVRQLLAAAGRHIALTASFPSGLAACSVRRPASRPSRRRCRPAAATAAAARRRRQRVVIRPKCCSSRTCGRRWEV